jgi:hypothetical protein
MWLRDDEYGWQLPTELTETLQWKRLWELDMKDQYFPLEPQAALATTNSDFTHNHKLWVRKPGLLTYP